MGPAVTVCECWPRDGLQSWPSVVPTSEKLEVIRAISDARVPEIDLTSFVPPDWVPQFADAEQVLQEAPLGTKIRVLAPNVRGAERAVELRNRAARIDLCGMPFSASEAHNIANVRRDHAAHRVAVREMSEKLLDAGIAPLLGVATAFGCPIIGRVDPTDVFEIVDWAMDIGIRDVMLADTTGMADPRAAHEMFDKAVTSWPEVRFIAHFHDTRGRGIANTVAAIAGGVTVVDACLGAIGGEPESVEQNHVGLTGNVSSEDLVSLLEQSGVTTGIDVEALVAAGALVERVLGRELRSQVQRTGLPRF
jgi:hydroxymethylglutaryl-CoA lyase